MPARGARDLWGVRDRWGGRRGLVAAGTAVLVLAAAGATTALAAADRLPGQATVTRTATPTTRTPTPPPAPPVLSPAGQAAGTGSPSALPAARLSALLGDPRLGSDASAVVLDAATGATLVDRRGRVPHTPASVAKLLTAAAALTAVGPATRPVTRAVVGGLPGQVVLVGGGDGLLTLRRDRRDAYPQRASLAALADATAVALRARAPGRVTVAVDDSLFTGPAEAPSWPASYVGSGVVARVSALSVDQGRVSPSSGSDQREPDPALAAGRDLGRLLRARGLEVGTQVSRGTAPRAAAVLGSVSGPTVAETVEAALQTSDNDVAEVLLRQVAVARGAPPTFAGGTAAVLAVLRELGVPTPGVVLADGSGLSRRSAVPPETLARLLALAATDPARPALRTLVTSLPVAGFSGTLAERYGSGRTRPAAGRVRAKTGTLTGVSSLAGVAGLGGRTVTFAVMSDSVPAGGTLGARDALDRFAAALAAGP